MDVPGPDAPTKHLFIVPSLTVYTCTLVRRIGFCIFRGGPGAPTFLIAWVSLGPALPSASELSDSIFDYQTQTVYYTRNLVHSNGELLPPSSIIVLAQRSPVGGAHFVVKNAFEQLWRVVHADFIQFRKIGWSAPLASAGEIYEFDTRFCVSHKASG